jgi:hypothetical protein
MLDPIIAVSLVPGEEQALPPEPNIVIHWANYEKACRLLKLSRPPQPEILYYHWVDGVRRPYTLNGAYNSHYNAIVVTAPTSVVTASAILWHELGHAWQFEHRYNCRQRLFIEDYRKMVRAARHERWHELQFEYITSDFEYEATAIAFPYPFSLARKCEHARKH